MDETRQSRLRVGGWVPSPSGSRGDATERDHYHDSARHASPEAEPPRVDPDPEPKLSDGRHIMPWVALGAALLFAATAAVGVGLRVRSPHDRAASEQPAVVKGPAPVSDDSFSPVDKLPPGTVTVPSGVPGAAGPPGAPGRPGGLVAVPTSSDGNPAIGGAPTTRKQSAPAAAVPASVRVSKGQVPDVVNLSAEGTLDWVHWGLDSASSLDRRAGGAGSIVDMGGTGPRSRYDTNPQRFSWGGGAPAGSAVSTPTGVYTCGEGSGFVINVDAGPTNRTLTFYAGVWQARGRLDVSLATGKTSATATLENQTTNATARFVIAFHSPVTTQLIVRWTVEHAYHAACGNVDMQAATLR